MPHTDRAVRDVTTFVVGHPRAVLLIFAAVTVVLAWQARLFRIDASADTLLMRNNRHYVQTQVMNRRFAPQEFLLIAYEPHDHALFSPRTFADLRAITDELQKIDRVESVRSILNVPLFALADGGLTADVDPARWTIEEQNYTAEELTRTFDQHPIYEDLLINKDGNATAIQVLFRSDEQIDELHDRIVTFQEKALDEELSKNEVQTLDRLKAELEPLKRQLDKVRTQEVSEIRDVLSSYEQRAGVYMGGAHVLGFQLIRIIRSDLIVFGSAIAGMICVILLILFRRIRWVVIPIVCCACSVVSTVGVFGTLGLKTTVISSNFIALQLILTLAIVVHLIVQYREYSASHADWDQAKLVRETLRRKAGPCFYAGVTTSVGFGSLLFSNIQPVIAFGWMMIIAMCFSIGVSLILFPAMMALFGREDAQKNLAPARALLHGFATVSLKHPVLIAVIGSAVLVAGVGGIVRLDVENSFLNYFRKSTRVRRELAFIDRQFGGSTPVDLVYTLPQAERTNDLVFTASTVQQLQSMQAALSSHEAVGKILSVVNLTALARQLNDNMPLTEYELTALYWTMEDSLRDDLLGSFYAPEHGQVRFSARIRDTTPGLNRAELLASIHANMQELGLSEDRYTLTNLFVLYQDILQRLFRSQMLTLGIVYLALALTFWGIFRSLKVALIGMIPNVFSTALVLGAMGWLGIPLDLMTITIAAIAMGIAVDDTIHYIHRYLEEIKDYAPDEAVKRSHNSVGFAVLYTSVIIALGFSLLTFSDFVPSILFGLLTGLAMLMALVSDMTVLPVLLRRFVQRET